MENKWRQLLTITTLTPLTLNLTGTDYAVLNSVGLKPLRQRGIPFIWVKDVHNYLGLDFPNQVASRGRTYFSERRSPEKQFKPIVKIVPEGDHWHPRTSRKKVFDISFTQNLKANKGRVFNFI